MGVAVRGSWAGEVLRVTCDSGDEKVVGEPGCWACVGWFFFEDERIRIMTGWIRCLDRTYFYYGRSGIVLSKRGSEISGRPDPENFYRIVDF